MLKQRGRPRYHGPMRWTAACFGISVWVAGLAGLTGLAACGGREDVTPAAVTAGRPVATAAAAAAPVSETSVGSGAGPHLGPVVAALPREPAIRVRVQTRVREAVLTAETAVRVAGPREAAVPSKVYQFTTPLRIRRVEGHWELRDAAGRAMRWQLPQLLVECDEGGTIALGDKRYPRRLVLVPRTADTPGPALLEDGSFDVVNHVALETYLAGVIERELYGSWPLETFKAQAVAARSYAVWEQTIASDRHYDLESSTASQAYIGSASNPTAVRAVAETRGQFLTYRGRVVPAFYSSSTGGTGQDAVLAFPNRIEDLPPLRGRAHGAWDQDSPQWRWGPVQRDAATLTRRIAAWGRDQAHPVAELGRLSTIEVAGRNSVGRPAVYRLGGVDKRGRAVSFDLEAESLRVACNDTDNRRLPLPKGDRLLSSHLEVGVRGGSFTFTGRGYGHGVGLSQWGAAPWARPATTTARSCSSTTPVRRCRCCTVSDHVTGFQPVRLTASRAPRPGRRSNSAAGRGWSGGPATSISCGQSGRRRVPLLRRVSR